jgi:hypothetical protein
VRGAGLAPQGSIPWYVPHALSRSRPSSDACPSSQDRTSGRRRDDRDALLDDAGDVNLCGPRQSYSGRTQLHNGSVRLAPERTAEHRTQPRTDLCQLLFAGIGGARNGLYSPPAARRSPAPALAWARTPSLATRRRAGASTASSPSGPTSGRAALHRVGRGGGPPTTASTDVPTLHYLLPPWVDLQLVPYANGRQAPVWMRTHLYYACTVVAERWASRTAPAQAPRPSTRSTYVHTLFTPLFTPFTPLFTPLFTPSTGPTVRVDPRHHRPGHPAGARAASGRHASAARSSTRRSPHDPAPLARTVTGGSRS